MAFDTSNDYTDFSDLDSGISNSTTQGLIEIDGAGAGFRYKKSIIANLPFSTTTIRDDWLVEVHEDDREDATVLFRQRVNFGVYVQSIGGPVPIFIARPADDEQIETSIINGEEIDPTTAHEHLDLGYQSEFGITTDFIANPGVDGGGVINGDWESLPYRQDLTEGNIFVIKHDGWRPIGLSKIATYQTSYLPGAPHVAGLLDVAGALRVARVDNGALEIRHTYTGAQALARRAILAGLREPSVWKDKTNRFWLGALQGNKYKLFYSRDDGRSFRAKQTPGEGGALMDVEIFDGSFKFQRSLGLKEGGAIAWAVRGGYIWTRLSPDGQDWSGPLRRSNLPAKRNEPYIIEEDQRTGALRLSNCRDYVLQSRDGGRTWLALP